MSLSPNDIRNMEFSNQMRGFDKEEVESFLETIATELEELKQVNLKLSMEADSMKTQLSSFRQHEDSIKQAMIDARRYADDTISKSKAEAEEIVKAATDEAASLTENNQKLSETFTHQINQLKDNKETFVSKIKELVSDHLEMINLVESDQPEINFDTKVNCEQEEPAYEAPAYEAPVEETPVVEAPAYEEPAYEAPVEETPVVEAPAYEAPVEEPPVVEEPTYEAPAYEAPVEETTVVDESNGITVTDSEDVTRENLESITDETSDDPSLDNNDAQEDEPVVGGTIINEEHEDKPTTGSAPNVVLTQQATPDSIPETEDESKIDPELAEALDKYQHLLNNKNESGPVPTPVEPVVEQHQVLPAEPVIEQHPVLQTEPAPTPKQGEMVETSQRADEIPEGFVVGNEVPEQNRGDHTETGKLVVPNSAENSNLAQPTETPADEQVSVAPQLTPDNIANEFDNIVAKFAEELEKAEQN